MSLTSCYRYILELPVDSLDEMLRAALSEDDSAGIAITGHWDNVAVGDNTATVDARPSDAGEATMTLTAADLGLSLHLFMRIEVDVNEIPELDQIVYEAEFDLPGIFEKEASAPPRLLITFPAVTEPDLHLAVSGGGIPLTPELVEPRIHALYDSNPELGHKLTPGQPWLDLDTGPTTVNVFTDIYDDDPGAPGFRGAITVEVPSATEIVLVMPGHVRILSLSKTYVDSDMTLRISVPVEQVDGEIRVKLSQVVSNDVAVAFDPTDTATTPGAYLTAATIGIKNGVSDQINDFPDEKEEIPTNAEIADAIAGQIVALAGGLRIPIFTPQPPGPDEIDLTTFVPTTVQQQALALQLEPLGDATPCDAPDLFTNPDGFAIAIAAVEVNRLMQPIFDNNLGDRSVEGYDITVNSLHGTLSNAGDHGQPAGHIWVEGEVEVHVDCWPDPDVSFWGPVTLVPGQNTDGKIFFTADAGGFDADDPCCGDVDPADIEALIEGEQSTPIALPRNFTDVGELNLGITDAVISSAGIVIHGTLDVLTLRAMHAASTRRTIYWFYEMAGGG